MGFCEEQDVRLVSTQVNVICNARLGLSHKLAEAILVERLPARSSSSTSSLAQHRAPHEKAPANRPAPNTREAACTVS